jgi:flagellar motor protein MotB
MTDMMVGMIFVFVILLMTFALSFREAEENRQTKIEQLETVETAKREILEDIKKSLQESGIKVEIDLENGILHLPEEILFPSGSATLNVRGRQSLEHLAKALYQVVPCYSASYDIRQLLDCEHRTSAMLDAVFVEGHTDNMPVSSGNRFQDNWDLSAQRAIETYKALKQIEPILDELVNEGDGKPQKLFSVAGYGEFRPRTSNDTDEGKQANRRIDLRFLMKTPRSEDLQLAEERISEEVVDDVP